jgi:hypothetical protein
MSTARKCLTCGGPLRGGRAFCSDACRDAAPSWRFRPLRVPKGKGGPMRTLKWKVARYLGMDPEKPIRIFWRQERHEFKAGGEVVVKGGLFIANSLRELVEQFGWKWPFASYQDRLERRDERLAAHVEQTALAFYQGHPRHRFDPVAGKLVDNFEPDILRVLHAAFETYRTDIWPGERHLDEPADAKDAVWFYMLKQEDRPLAFERFKRLAGPIPKNIKPTVAAALADDLPEVPEMSLGAVVEPKQGEVSSFARGLFYSSVRDARQQMKRKPQGRRFRDNDLAAKSPPTWRKMHNSARYGFRRGFGPAPKVGFGVGEDAVAPDERPVRLENAEQEGRDPTNPARMLDQDEGQEQQQRQEDEPH